LTSVAGRVEIEIWRIGAPKEACMKITVIGTGHVGLVAGACLAEIGHDVVCVDNDPSKIEALRAGRAPFFEPDMEAMVQRNQKRGLLSFSGVLQEGIAHSEVIFLCLGTPPLPSGEADLSVVERVTHQIATLADGYKLVISKSTVPVLTGDRIQRTMEVYSGGKHDLRRCLESGVPGRGHGGV
jgi:UDPglucose 6-dehydrogenase